MTKLLNQYTRTETVRTCDIGATKRMTIPSLVNGLQETAMHHAMQLKLSVWDMEEDHLAWVLFRKHLKIFRQPILNEEFQIQTYPCGFERLFVFRDFKATDAQGNPVATASSTWLLMNTKTRRPARMTPKLASRFPEFVEEELWLDRPTDKLPVWKQAENKQEHTVTWHQIDFNHHLNNVEYFQLLLDVLPMEVLAKQQLSDLNIHFYAEAGLNDKLSAEVMSLSDNHFLHRLVRHTDDKVLAMAETRWEK